MENNDNLVDLSLYKLFYLVYQNGSFSKTAEAIGLTQPTISYNIKKLENQLGTQLFERGSNLTLTPEGEQLIPYVAEALNCLRNAENKINEIINLKKGQIRIGIPSHIGVFLLTDIIKKFNKQYPYVNIFVNCKPTKELFRLLYLNDLDLVIDSSPLEENIHDFVIKKISNENCSFACNFKRKELLNKKNSIEEICKYPLIVPLKTSSSTKSLIEIFNKNKINFEPLFEITTSDMIAEMIDNDLGIGFLFEKTINKYPNLKKIEVNFELPSFDIYLIYKSIHMSIPAINFIEFITKKNV